MATAFWAPKATNPDGPHETLLTMRLHPDPMNSLPTSMDYHELQELQPHRS